jgi:hypothetical protein
MIEETNDAADHSFSPDPSVDTHFEQPEAVNNSNDLLNVTINGQSSSELHKQLYQSSKNLIKEGEKNVTLALEVSKQKDELDQLRQEAASFRSVLLQGINGGVTDSNNYEHVSLEALLRIRLQVASTSTSTTTNNDASTPQMLARDESSVGVIQKLEHKLALEVKHNDELEAKCISLKDELNAATKQNKGVQSLHVKISEMSQRLRNERELKSKLNKDLAGETKKVEALSDHIEKLMVHLKHEAISKARSLADQSLLQRELDMAKTRIEHMSKKNERKDKVITELRETGKLLEDQLRLMDEKYMEIRSKLDWTRSQTSKIVKQKEVEFQHLRENFSLVTSDSTPRSKSHDVSDLLLCSDSTCNSLTTKYVPHSPEFSQCRL